MNSLPSEAGLLSQASLVTKIGFISEVIYTVKELASLSIHAVALLHVLSAQFGLIVGWQVLLWHQLVHTVGVRARITVLTVMVHDNIPAHFRLLHLLDFLVELESLFPVNKLLLLCGPGGLAGNAADVISDIGAAVGMIMWSVRVG